VMRNTDGPIVITCRTLKMGGLCRQAGGSCRASDCQRLLKWHDYSNTCQVHRALLMALSRASQLIADLQSSQREVKRAYNVIAHHCPSRISFGNSYFLNFPSSLSTRCPRSHQIMRYR
jgi:hypothetical protein